jgi:probable phosphoglycerate mutase
MPSPTVYFIRHGQTEWNATGRFQGSQDIPLNEIGKGQAIRSGELLTDILARDELDPAKVPFVSSPLGRARNTMELLRGVLGVPPHDYELDDRLREIGYGHWEGSTLPQMEQSHPEIFAERQVDKWGVPPPGGELCLGDHPHARVVRLADPGHGGGVAWRLHACCWWRWTSRPRSGLRT